MLFGSLGFGDVEDVIRKEYNRVGYLIGSRSIAHYLTYLLILPT